MLSTILLFRQIVPTARKWRFQVTKTKPRKIQAAPTTKKICSTRCTLISKRPLVYLTFGLRQMKGPSLTRRMGTRKTTMPVYSVKLMASREMRMPPRIRLTDPTLTWQCQLLTSQLRTTQYRTKGRSTPCGSLSSRLRGDCSNSAWQSKKGPRKSRTRKSPMDLLLILSSFWRLETRLLAQDQRVPCRVGNRPLKSVRRKPFPTFRPFVTLAGS
mmetsp:Transcript_23996/g.56818  ORF Transcript_23996/g.56818 Transcript_23996/m.56818 type:complete len:214 (+) Transcript_23996:1444-2085(+)